MHSAFLAQVIGWYLFLMGLAFLMNQAHFKKIWHDTLTNPALTTLWGAVSMIFGLIVVISHRVWVSDWPVVVTLMGWFLLLNGAARIFLPEHVAKFYKSLHSKLGFGLLCWFWLLVGLYLIWMGHSHACC